jgi:hypothetical protein
MNKLPVITLLIFCFSFLAFAQTENTTPKTIEQLKQQSKNLKDHRKYDVSYDKFDDMSVVRFSGNNLVTSGEQFGAMLGTAMRGSSSLSNIPILLLGAGFIFNGDTLKESPKDYYIYFDYSGESWAFIKNSKLIFLVDGERIQFGDGEADRTIKKQGGVSEIIGFKASKDDLLKIGNGKSVELKIGSLARKLKPEQSQMFLNVVSLGDLSERPAAH